VIVVLDTNVWVSALEFGGVPDRAVFRALTVDQPAISDFIYTEIVRVLTGKFGRDLLSLGSFRRTRIISPAAYLEAR